MLPRNGVEPIVFQYFFELVYIFSYIAQPFYRFIVEEIYIGFFFMLPQKRVEPVVLRIDRSTRR